MEGDTAAHMHPTAEAGDTVAAEDTVAAAEDTAEAEATAEAAAEDTDEWVEEVTPDWPMAEMA